MLERRVFGTMLTKLAGKKNAKINMRGWWSLLVRSKKIIAGSNFAIVADSTR